MFRHKKVGEIPQYTGRKDLLTKRMLIKAAVIVLSIGVVVGLGYTTVKYVQGVIPKISMNTAKAIGETIGETMQKDQFGNINVLVVGYAGGQNRGSFLMDSIMLASFNPKLGAVTFLSVPRDLYVSYGDGYGSKINGIYWNIYLANDNDEKKAIQALSDEVSEITGIEIPYYVMVNFDGFVQFIDELGGITVDVPSTISDPYYPGPNDTYTTFRIDRGEQTLDGETALQYARSRKTTSDSDRSLRQQQIIEGVIEKMTASMNLSRMSELKPLYQKFRDVFATNITFKQMLGLAQYLGDEHHFFSYVYSAGCDTRYLETVQPGCLLYNADRDLFGGMSVMLPDGATPGNVSYYKKTRDFAFWVVHNQQFLIEQAPVRVFNGIDTSYANEQGYRVTGVATDMARELKMKGFLIEDVDNAEEPHQATTLYTSNREAYDDTIELIKAFVEVDTVQSGTYNPYGTGVTLVLGNDYLERL